MSDRDSGSSFVQNRRQFLSNTAAIGSASLLPAALTPQAASAQGVSDTLVIAAPATPQGLDIEFDVSLGSIDTLGVLYEYMLGYEKMADPNAPDVLREDTGVHPDKPNGLALKGKLAESWELAPGGRNA
jgi:peptide/nickel transport system substrate-binding protein